MTRPTGSAYARAETMPVLLAFIVLASSVACGSSDRAYHGRSADVWASQLSSVKAEDRMAAADALYYIVPQTDKVIAALVNAMRDSIAEVQSSVAVALATVGPRALPGLTEAIGDDHASVRALAIDLLAKQGSSGVVALPQITKALADPDDGVRRSAALALERFGPLARSAAPALALGARNGTPELRAACLLALASSGADTAVALPAARASLNDAAAVVRRAAVSVVSRVTPDAGAKFSILAPYLRDRDPSVRLETYRAMGSLLSDQAVGPVAHAALVLARADADSSARTLVQQLLSPPVALPEEPGAFHSRRGVVTPPR